MGRDLRREAKGGGVRLNFPEAKQNHRRYAGNMSLAALSGVPWSSSLCS